MKGELPLLQKVKALQMELLQTMPGLMFEGVLEEEAHLVSIAKKIFMMTGGSAVQKYQLKLEQEQEVLSHLADMMIQIYAMESTLLRTRKRINKQGEQKVSTAIEITRIYVHEAFDQIEAFAKETLSAIEEGVFSGHSYRYSRS